jgi:hypothetical protein
MILYRSVVVTFLASLIFSSPAFCQPYGTVGEASTGQWAEGRDRDPFVEQRPVQIYIPIGTLLFDLSPADGLDNYVNAVTYHGIPVRIIRKIGNAWTYDELEADTRNALRLVRPIFCPGASGHFTHSDGKCWNDLAPIGEGWTFYYLDGNPDDATGRNFLLSATVGPDIVSDWNLNSSTMQFPMSKHELDRWETKGALIRLDRNHPLHLFKFIDSLYFPCGMNEKKTLEHAVVQEFGAEIEAGVGFNFLEWLTAKISLSANVGVSETDTKTTTISYASETASLFQQWGVMRDLSEGEKPDVPFMIEKSFECKAGIGPNAIGDRIINVSISFWNHEEQQNTTLEFSTEWLNRNFEISEVLYTDLPTRPVYISINSPKLQNTAIDLILEDYNFLHYNQAAFIFSQLNNACSSQRRDACQNHVKFVPGVQANPTN